MSANQLSFTLDSPAHGGSEQGLVRQWSADCTPEVLAMEVVADLCKKFRQLDAMPAEKFETIAQGLVDGLKGTTFAYPGGGSIPDYRQSMKPDYCAGFEVGSTAESPTNTDNMKDFYQGSVSPTGTSQWTDPHDVSAVTAQIAAIEVLKSHAEVHDLALQQEMDVCVRQVDIECNPLGEWQYFRGKAWIVHRAEAVAISPANDLAEARRNVTPLREKTSPPLPPATGSASS